MASVHKKIKKMHKVVYYLNLNNRNSKESQIFAYSDKFVGGFICVATINNKTGKIKYLSEVPDEVAQVIETYAQN